MASRAVSNLYSPPLSCFISKRFFLLRTPSLHRCSSSNLRIPNPPVPIYSSGVGPTSQVHSLVDSVMEELQAMQSRKRIRAINKMGLPTSKELFDVKLEKRVLQKGLLLEFRKDSQKLLLGVTQKPDGKRNWMVYDQNGTVSSIKPQQVTYIVPGIEDFCHTDIHSFIHKAQDLLDPTMLECAWAELSEKRKSVTAEELAEIIYGSNEALESYCAHLLLSQDEIYFNGTECKGSCTIYDPRPIVQVEELSHRKRVKEEFEKEVQEFAKLLMSAKAMPIHCKPPKSSWMSEAKVKRWIKAIEAYAVDACKNDEQKKTAGTILKAMGFSKTSNDAR